MAEMIRWQKNIRSEYTLLLTVFTTNHMINFVADLAYGWKHSLRPFAVSV